MTLARTMGSIFVCGAALVASASASAAPLRVATTEAGGGALAETLLIVRALDERGELFRALTDKAGEMPAHELETGRYRVIATYPHGPWKTAVREFVVETSPVALRLSLAPVPVDAKKARPAKKARIPVLTVDAKARPVGAVAILVRNPEATVEAWYQTNAKGEVVVDVGTFVGAVTLVSFHGANVTEREISTAEIATLTRKRGRVILRVI